MDAPEVPEDKGVSGFRLVRRSLGKRQMPRGVFIPRMRLQERVLVGSLWLNLIPHAAEDVLVRVDEPFCVRHRTLVDGVRGDG
jgi:hypothetical protein